MVSAKILLIDDEVDLAGLTAKILQAFGYTVFCHFEGTGALEVIRKLKPDLVLLDLMLPDVSGFEILRAIRGDGDLSHLPVVIFSAIAHHEETRLKAALANEFVKKPYEISSLATAINRVLQLNHREFSL